ncbi:polymorphic toxin-type HINT domain-containing protein [Actinoplanes rectilineatus]|uniref:polymorphic toxin-type HINT domain-containing protein n=1 Tax=Actinoplanes rectilineatus TaxID=113571 RepID=UPI000696E1B4|nr:polymorphic toxin-type HINT domain-containing protein [Actinoplanes rectilineatus]
MSSSKAAGRRLLSKPRMAIAASLAVTLVLGLGHAPAMAYKPDPYKAESSTPVPEVAVKAAKIAPAPKLAEPPPASARPAPVWPKAADEIVTVDGQQATSLPVRVESSAKRQAAPSKVQVEVLDREITEQTGVRGVLMRLGRADGLTGSGTTKMTLDYRSFATAYGADWSSRLRLVSMPECALTTPDKDGCESTALATDNDVAAQTLSAEVTVDAASTLVAATAATSGPAGDYSATTLTSASTWSAGGNSGDFAWNYPMTVPPSLGGPAPSLQLAYSSQSVDGRHAASNNQPSRVGEGFEEPAGGYIERRYIGCSDDRNGSANNDEKTGDLCWETDNATLSLAGHSGELIYNATEARWHLRSDDGTRIERKTGSAATNGDNNGEYWVVTTTDGVQYWFGVNRLPGWTSSKSVTNSVLTVPVFGNDPGEPCNATAFIDSDCMQAWRWNLDYVVDTLGNSMSYWYQKSTNKYARNMDESDAASYDREAVLDRIDYGTRRSGGIDSVHGTLAPMRVDFTYEDRCLSECDKHNATRWPDVPWDSECTGDTCKDQFAPSFWSTKRLATVTTQVRDGTTYRDVDRWTLTHTFPDPGDGTRAGLWLSKISHAGLVGGTATLPDVEFTPVQKANRVDITGDFATAMNWMRIARIRTETGATVSVVYSEQDCTAGATPAPATNTSRCYPVKWVPEGYEDPVTDWFNKYVVTTIYEQDNTGGVPPLGSPQKTYQYTYYDGAAWHYTDDDGLTKKKYKTWSDYRGYGRVGVTVGDAGESVYSETRYFRGIKGDRLNADGGVKPGDVDGIADEDWFAGQVRQSTTFLNGPGSAVVSKTLNTPWASDPTASRTINGDTVTARFTGVSTITNHVTLDNGRGERVTKTVNTFDEYGMVTKVDDLGQDGVSGDEQCTVTTYTPRNTSAWILDHAHSVRKYAVACGATTGTLAEAQVIGETRTTFDALAYGTAPTKGLPTLAQEMSAWNNGNPTFVTIGKTAYDAHGRLTTATDANGYAITTAYTPATDGPLTSITTTNYLEHTTTATIDPVWGVPTATVDANGKRTDSEYDPLGRLTSVWMPGRVKGTDTPNVKYTYALNTGAPSVVSTSALNAAGDYVTSYTLYDGLLRPRQTQSPSSSGGRIISESFYDSVGREHLTYGAYHASGNPGTTLLATTDSATVPTQTRTRYDGAGRAVASIFEPYGVARWQTTTAYAGDRTDTTPPSGGTATSVVTDARGRATELREYLGATPTPFTANSWVSTEYKYDARGYQTQLVDHLDNDWSYTYDLRGRQTQVDDPDRGKTTFTYDNLGNILTSTDARGEKIAYAYDALNRKTEVYDDQIGGVIRAQWTYDTIAKGQLSESTRYVGSALYQVKIHDYNDSYQPGNTEIVIPTTETGLTGNYHYNTTYNLDGSVRSSSLPETNTGLSAERLTYAYNAFGQPTTVDSLYGSTNQAYVTGTDYNALGQLDQVKLYTGTGDGGRVYTKYTRELETGRLTNIRTDRDSVAPYILTDTTYQYDDAGNIIKVADAAPETVDDTQCFTYDQLARLTQAWTPASGDCNATPAASALGGPAPYWLSWTVDAIGNRTSETVHTSSGNATTGYTYPPSGANSVRPHALTSTTGAKAGSYTYDAAGNTLTRPTASSGTQTLTWDPEGHVDSVTDSTGTTRYIYDASGNRLVQRDPTGRTLYLPGQEIRYNNSTATTSCTRYYSHAGATIGSRTSSGLTWLSPDHQGTASIAVNAANQQATTRRQTPYGTPRGATVGAWPNNRGYLGGTTDNTGLTHLGAREYDPAIGRFISVDPLHVIGQPQQWNGYAYTENSPVTYSDPSGLGRTPWDDQNNEPRGDGSPNTGRGHDGDGGDGGSDGDGGGDGGVDVTDNGDGSVNVGGVTVSPDQVYDFEAFKKKVNIAYYSYLNDWGNEWKAMDADTKLLWTMYHACNTEGSVCSSIYAAQIRDTLHSRVKYNSGCTGECLARHEYMTASANAMLDQYVSGSGSVRALKVSRSATIVGASQLKSMARGERIACVGNSFTADTEVLMADGSTKEIADVRIGDLVLATDPETGESRAEKVAALIIGSGSKNLVTITVDDVEGSDSSEVTSTDKHPFWVPGMNEWVAATDLHVGQLLRTGAGTRVQITAIERWVKPQVTVHNLTVDDLHTYYVLAGDTPVLVHNCGVTLLGKYRGTRPGDPNALKNFMDDPDFNVLEVPAKGTGRWRWNKNKRFIDDAIERGDEIRLMQDPADFQYDGGIYKKELQYLQGLGYSWESRGAYWVAKKRGK